MRLRQYALKHTLGLDHQDTNFDNKNLGTCMDYTSNPYGPPDNEHPDQHDYDELVTIYSHLDSTTTVGQTAQEHAMPPAMSDLDYDTHRNVGGRRSRVLARAVLRF